MRVRWYKRFNGLHNVARVCCDMALNLKIGYPVIESWALCAAGANWMYRFMHVLYL